MITCPITKLPIEKFYKYLYASIREKLGKEKPETFDIDDFLNNLFAEIAKDSDNATAAKWLQSAPRIINLILNDSFATKLGNVKGLSNIYSLMDEFSKPGEEGINNVITKYVKKVEPADIKTKVLNTQNTEFGSEEEDSEESPSRIISPANLRTFNAISGTLPAYLPVDPRKKDASYVEQIDPARVNILATLDKIGDAYVMQDNIANPFEYQGVRLKVKAVNLEKFANGNMDKLDTTTQKIIRESNALVQKGRAKEGVSQNADRVIMVLTDAEGNNLYFDNEGNIVSKNEGTLVYQFMRDVRKTSTGYTIMDMYGMDEQIASYETIAKATYSAELDGNFEDYVSEVKANIQKEYKELFDLRNEALSDDQLLDFSGITSGVSSEFTSTKIPLNELLQIPGINKKDLKTIHTLNKSKNGISKGRAVIRINGNEFQINRSKMTQDIANQIAAVMFDNNISYETKKDFYSQFIPEDNDVKLAYTMRKHQITANPNSESFTIKLYDKTGSALGFTTEPIFNFVVSKKSLEKALPEQVEKGIKAFSDALMKGSNNNSPTNMSYKSNLLNEEDYMVYDINTKKIGFKNYFDLLTTLDGTVEVINADPGFYNKHLLFELPTKVNQEINKSQKETSEDPFLSALDSARAYAEEKRISQRANMTPLEIEFERLRDYSLTDEYKFLLAEKGIEAKYDSFLMTSYLTNQINLNYNNRYTKESAKELLDMFVANNLINDKQAQTVQKAINEQFPTTDTKVEKEIRLVEKTTEPEMPNPTNSLLSRIPNRSSLDRKGYTDAGVTEEEINRAQDFWDNSELGKSLQANGITLDHAVNLVNSNVFAQFVVSGATLTNPEIKGSIKINPAKGSMVDVYHEAWHAFSQLYLTRDEKYSLYDELKNSKDAKGKQPYADKSYEELEEILAEDFRTYMKSSYTVKGAPVRNSLFKRILNFLKGIFGKKANHKDVVVDVMSVPAVKELFENLNFNSNKKGSLNNYKPLVDNILFSSLNRGIRKTNKPSQDALSVQDSNLINDTMDMAVSMFIDDIFKERLADWQVRKQQDPSLSKPKSLKSGTIGMLLDPENRAFTYTVIKERLQDKLNYFKSKLHAEPGIVSFSNFNTLEDVKSNAAAILKASDGQDKYIFLSSQVDGFENLTPDIKKGDRVKGESWHGIKITGDFFNHKTVKKDKKPVGIIIVSSIEDAQQQFDNYIAGGAKKFTSIELKQAPSYELTQEQENTLDNVRILQAALDNYGDPEWEAKGIDPTGTIAYHLENSDFEISQAKFYIDTETLDSENEEEDEDVENESHDSEVDYAEKTGKKSIMQLASKEVLYILKSLHKVNRKGETAYNKLGFPEKSDFRKVWNVVTKTIGGIRDRELAYQKLEEESKNFPELAQLINFKFPDPKGITNSFEMDVSNSFWKTFAKPSVEYWQFTVFPQKGISTNEYGETSEINIGFESDVTQSSIEIDSTIKKFESNFKGSFANDYISKTGDNQSVVNTEAIVKDFEDKKYPGQLNPKKAFEFAASLGIKLDDIKIIKQELLDNIPYYGLEYIYDIVKDFNDLKSQEELSGEQKEFLEKFLNNPINTLKNEIPKGVLKSFKKEVTEKNILKRLAELQVKYGYDSANPGILLPDGNRVFGNVNHSQVTVTVDAINRVESLDQLWEDPSFQYMSHLKPSKSFFTQRSKLLGSLFNMDTYEKIGDKRLGLMMVAGTQIADVEGTNTSDLDKSGKFLQEFHTMLLSGIAEFIRHAEKKSSFGAKIFGGLKKVVANGISRGVDKNLYIDISKFKVKEGQTITDGEIVAVGGYFLDYIAVEFDRIRYFKNNRSELETIKGYNRVVGKDSKGDKIYAGEVFTLFDNILTPATKKALYKLTDDLTLDLPTHIENDQELYLAIQKDIVGYFTEKAHLLEASQFNEMSYIDDKLYDKLGVTTEEINTNPNHNTSLLKAYLYNDWIHKFETFNLFNGDAAQFNHDKEEASKRAPGSTSDGDGFINDVHAWDFINNVFNKNTYAKKLSKELGQDLDKFVLQGKLNTGVIADAERESIYLNDMTEAWREAYKQNGLSDAEIEKRLKKDKKAYEEMKESDGSAFITFDAYRTLKKLGNEWSIAQESLYQQIINGEEVDPKKVKQFFSIYKLHYYGPLANAPVATTAMHKFAVSPIIPTIAKPGTQLYNLHVKMLKENKQYVLFGSGSKVSALTNTGSFDDIFADAMQKEVSMEAPMKNNEIYLEYLKDVTKVAVKLKNEISYPTQKRVLLLDGLFNVGEIINKAHTDITKKYTDTVSAYTNALTTELLNKIGYEFKDGKYVGQLDKFISLIREELGTKEVPDHLIKLLDTTVAGNLKMDFSLHPEADVLEKIIVNRIQKSIVKQKTKGEALIQAPTTFYNGIWDNGFDVLKDPEDIKKYLGTNILPFYRRGTLKEDGTRELTSAMKVAIPFNGEFINLLKLKGLDNEPINTLDRLNEAIKNDEWVEEYRDVISIAGPRIPTDAANTIEFAEVWHFIDAAAGNTVIVPTEIVAKAGSDFDVDKIFFMFPSIEANGELTKPVAASMEEFQNMVNDASLRKDRSAQSVINQQKRFLQNELIKSTREILSLSDNFANLTKPNHTYLVEDEVEFYDRNASGYNNKNNAHGEVWRENGGKLVMSPTRILDVEYNLSKHEQNLSGSLPLSIMAKKNKIHALFKSIGAVMPKTYKATVWSDVLNQYLETDVEYNMVMRMAHNKTADGSISLSNENNINGDKIGDIFSHGLQGLLDRAKNPFPFTLQIVKEGLPVINHLLESGVSIEAVFAFINNPLIVDYIKKQMYYSSSTAKLLDEPVEASRVKFQAASEIINNFYSNASKEDKVKYDNLLKLANGERLYAIADQLSKEDLDKEYTFLLFDTKKPVKATGERLFKGNFDLSKVKELRQYTEGESYYEQDVLYKFKQYLPTNDNYYYAAQLAWDMAFKGNAEINAKELKSLITEEDKASFKNLAVFLHMIQLEKQFSGMDSLELMFSPDTGMLDTTLQVKKRDKSFNLFMDMSKIDSDLLKKLRYDSILSSFYKSDMILDLVLPLFPLRLNDTISTYLERTISDNRELIAQKYGTGVKGQERFTNMFNNAVVNYIYQNTMSNFTDENGQPVALPESVHSMPVKKSTTSEKAVELANGVFTVNLDKAEKEYASRAYLSNNNTPEGFKERGLDTFNVNDNPFSTFASYLKYLIEKEYITSIYPEATEAFKSERALINSFNRAYIMGTTKYSYTQTIMNIIQEFGETLTDNYPVLTQLAPAKFVKDAQILELNDKATAKGTIADTYYKNLKQLGDITVRKVKDPEANKKISDAFKNFSLMMFYQHGVGYSKLGFSKILDPENFVAIMQNAANSFLNNDLELATLNKINTILSSREKFKNYLIDPTHYSTPETTVQEVVNKLSESDLETLSNSGFGTFTKEVAKTTPDFIINSTTDEITEGTFNYIMRKGKAPVDYKVIKVLDNQITVRNEETAVEKTFTEAEYRDVFNVPKDTGFSIRNEKGVAEVHNTGLTLDNKPVYSLEINLFNEGDTNKGYGKEIYLGAIAEITKRNGYLIPGQVVEGNKIWESFQRDGLTKAVTLSDGTKTIIFNPSAVQLESDSKKIVEDLFTKAGGKKTSKGLLQVDGQHWYINDDFWKIVFKSGRDELFFYPNEDTEIYIGSRPTGTKNFTVEDNIDTRSFTELAANPISDFYDNLDEEQKKILGNLDDLISDYEDIPFDYSEEEYIDSLKCKL